MINPQSFETLEEMHTSNWIKDLKTKFSNGEWPDECIRCRQTEEMDQGSIRKNSIDIDEKETNQYLIVGGTLDNICNSACQTCNSSLSTLLGKLDKTYKVVDNSTKFWQLPLDRIVQLDINGGEPSVSKNYKYILNNLPTNIKRVRVNTNCNLVLDKELSNLIDRQVEVTVTVSLDGIDKIHDYVRWPIKWQRFYDNLMAYKAMPIILNTWTTVSALNICDFQNILDFVKEHDLDHSWSLLKTPSVLDVKYTNSFTNVEIPDVLKNRVAIDRNNQTQIDSYITLQDRIRGIEYRNFYACV